MHNKISAERRVSTNRIRRQTLAGMFYPKNADELESFIAKAFENTVSSVSNPYGILAPHAGYIYSGHCAAVSYSKIDENFDGTFVILAPSHNGFMTSTSDMDWETPFGIVESDKNFISVLGKYIPVDNRIAQAQENSIEVQLPFIKYRFKNAKIVPVLLGDQSLQGAEYAADGIIRAIKETGIIPKVIASGDGSHYVERNKALNDDLECAAALKNLDIIHFYRTLREVSPSMCGYGCMAAMAKICKTLGAKESRVLIYETSGDATGDYSQVVGYLSMELV